MKRILLACAWVVLSVVPAMAQTGTVMPIPLAQWFDNNGDPLSAGGLCVYAAGTSTLATTYTTAALSVANTNPILFNSAGRPTSGGVFLAPGESYKFSLVDFTSVGTPACTPVNGVTLWTVDNVEAVPGASSAVVVTGATAGESIAAGDAVYLSDGAGSRTQGTWYRTDADFTYASSEAWMVGVAEQAINSGDTGTITISGRVTVAGPLSPGTRYWATATPGAYAAAIPANARRIGVASSTTAIIVSPDTTQLANLGSAYVYNAVQIANLAQGRCTLTTGVPVTTSDVTAATTLYYAPYIGNQIGLYTGSVWQATTFSQLSIAVPATTVTMYDVFVDYNDGTPQLAVTAWTNDTTRATALTTQDGVYVKTGDTQQRYVCSFRTTAVSGQTSDSFAARFLWNYYNRVPRVMRVVEATNTWNYTTNTWRCTNTAGACVNQIAFVIGVAEESVDITAVSAAFNSGGSATMGVAVGLDSTSAPTTGNIGMTIYAPTNGDAYVGSASLRVYPAVGYHFAAWLEISTTTSGTTTWSGDTQAAGGPIQTGISGVIRG